MKRLSFLLLFTLYITVVNGQTFLKSEIVEYIDDYNVYKVLTGDQFLKYLPSPSAQYSFKTFIDGELKLKDGKTISSGKYNYNIIRDELQFTLNGDTLSFLQPQNIKAIHMGDKVMTYSWYRSRDDLFRGFFEVIADGKYQLLYKTIATFVEATPALALKEPVKAHYEFSHKYYVLKENEIALIIWNKKELKKYFESEGIDVATIMKTEKIKFNKRDQMARLFGIINKGS